MATRSIQFVDRLSALSYPAILLLWIVNVLMFAGIFVFCSFIPGSSPTGLDMLDLPSRFLGALYFSIITSTTTGFGDIVPNGISRIFASAEAFSGFFLFALFMSKLVSRQQDIAITQMHKISFESTFHDIREDLHIVRGDFDKLIRSAREKSELSTSEWAQLVIALQQIENLMAEVPNFYDRENNLYRIDERRERLLGEAFHRTLERLSSTLEVFVEMQIEWQAQALVREQLQQLLVEVEKDMQEWKSQTDSDKEALFQSLEAQFAKIRIYLTASR